MAYTKQTWTDDVSAVTGARMTHIEDGIYANSTNIDTINNNVNPSGTATTTQTDFTEGQLTQKLGLKYVKMKGQTSQASDPTPTNPVDVNVVTGSNVIKIGNKNILNLKNNTYSSNGLTAVVNNQEITISGTSTNASTMDLQLEDDIVLDGNYSVYIKYTGTNTNVTAFQTLFRNASDTNIWIYQLQNYSYNANELKNNASGTIHYIRLYISPTGSVVNGTLQIMINKASTLDNNYIQHQEQNYEIGLGGSQLIDFSTLSNSNTTNSFKDNVLTVSTTSGTYANAYKDITTLYKNNAGKVLRFDFSSITSNVTPTTRIVGLRVVTSGTTANHTLVDANKAISTHTIPSDTSGVTSVNLTIYANNTNTATINTVKVVKPILHFGSNALNYELYNENPIELCKIGDYQDYIHKNNGKWYKHKAVGKVTLDGTETWSYSSGNLVFYTDVINTLAKSNTSLYCTHYKPVDNSTTYANMNSGEIKAQHDNSLNVRLIIKNTAITSANDFKTWLASNNTSVYYQLITPIEEEITYEPLIAQLDKLDKIGLYDISNISQDNSDMKMLLDFTICNDNYNGLREFIRA